MNTIKNKSMMRYKGVMVILVMIAMITGAPVKAFLQTTDYQKYFPQLHILQSNDPEPGYYFLATKTVIDTTLRNFVAIVDNRGIPVYFRLADGSAAGIQVREDGIYLNEGTPKKYYRIDTMMMKVDTFTTSGFKLDGHDIDVDAGGHILLLGNDPTTMDLTGLGGAPNATVRDKIVQEFDTNGNLLYTWKGLDHFQVTDANEDSPYVDFTASSVDYLHANALAFDTDTSFLLSCRHFDEITKIDRRTGEIIWRLGGKNNQFTFVNDTIRFSHPHTIRKLDNGHILLFDNGNLHQNQVSSTVEYQLDEAAMTATLVHRQYHRLPVFADHAGGGAKLAGGNLLVYWGLESPSFTEYHPDGSVALEMDFSDQVFSNRVGKSLWHPRIFTLSTDSVYYGMWDGYTESNYLLEVRNQTDSVLTLTGYHTHTPWFYIRETFPVAIPAHGDTTLTVTYFPETAGTGFVTDVLTLQADYPHVYIGSQVFLSGRKEDLTAPVLTLSPDSANVPRDAVVTARFSEPVRLTASADLDYINVDTLFIFKKTNENGADVPFNAVVRTDKTEVTLFPDDSLETNQTYYVALKDQLEDYSGNKLQTGFVKFSTGDEITALAGTAERLFSVYPNPSRGTFTIRFSEDARHTVEIFDMTGHRIYSSGKVEGPVYRGRLTVQKTGLYLLRVIIEDGRVETSKLVLISRE